MCIRDRFIADWFNELVFVLTGNKSPAFDNKGLNALYKNATKITETTAFIKVVAALNFAKAFANSWGCPKIYCL